jgi:hypothetical protein
MAESAEEKANICNSFMFKTSIGSMSSKRAMPNDGIGIVDFKIVNPYTGTVTAKAGTSSTNNTNISKAMKYSQYVNCTRGFKNIQKISYKEYVEKYGPLTGV